MSQCVARTRAARMFGSLTRPGIRLGDGASRSHGPARQRADPARLAADRDARPRRVRLAKLELQEKGKRLGAGAGLLGGAGLVAVFAAGALVAAAILALATVLEGWLAALLVAVGLLALAGVLALAGKARLEAGTPPVPEEAIESTKHDVETIREHARR